MKTAGVGIMSFRRGERTAGVSVCAFPAIIISPFTKHGGIDNTKYETVSILKLIERRFHLAPLSSRDQDPAVNDLTHALGLTDRDHDSD